MLRLLLGYAFSAALLLALLVWAQRQGVDWRVLSTTPWSAWAGLLLGLVVSYGLRAARMQAELSVHQPVAGHTMLKIALLHNAAVNVLPMRSGELAYPLLLRRHLGLPLEASISSLTWMRLQDLMVIAALALALFAPWSIPVKLLLIGAGALLASVLLRQARQRWGHPIGQPPPANPSRWQAFQARIRRFVSGLLAQEKHALVTWWYCVANWLVKLASVAWFLSIAVDLPAPTTLAGALAGELAALWPLQGPANLGTYDAAVWATITLQQKTALADLPAFILLMHALMFALAVLLGWLSWLSLKNNESHESVGSASHKR